MLTESQAMDDKILQKIREIIVRKEPPERIANSFKNHLAA